MRIPDDSFLKNTPIAHRGYHDQSLNIPENSYAAFDRAINFGYAIETDVRFTKDGKIVLFHDDTLNRMTDGTGKVYDKTFEELQRYTLGSSEEKIPEFNDFLNYINGRVPLLIEIKHQPERSDLVSKTIDCLKNYKGEFALQSFHPLYVLEMKKAAPQILRGQLATFMEKFSLKNHIIKNMNLNFITKPDFISYNSQNLPFSKAKKKDKLLLAWTVRTEEEYYRVSPYVDNVIFENIRPEMLSKNKN